MTERRVKEGPNRISSLIRISDVSHTVLSCTISKEFASVPTRADLATLTFGSDQTTLGLYITAARRPQCDAPPQRQ